MNLIRLIDKEKADMLSAIGFPYREEDVSGHTTYCFWETTEIILELKKHYSSHDYLISKIINF